MKYAIIALLFTAILSVLIGPLLIPLLKSLRFGQMVRDDGPKSHLTKAGTPTMGGLIFLISVTIITYFFVGNSTEVLLALAAFIGYGIIGFIDDFTKIALKRSLGLKARQKLIGEIGLGLLLGLLLIILTDRGTEISFFKYTFNLGWFYPFFALLVLVATTNAVNLTDGLDGLAAGTMFFSSISYLLITHWLDMNSLTVFVGALAGGCLGFLVFNRYPAKVFMGDTGSLALGGALGILAILTKTELLLFVIGGIYVAEALSVIIQVISFQLTGKRVFLMSPLHHHFELAGWHETKVVKVFWSAAFFLSLFGAVLFFP